MSTATCTRLPTVNQCVPARIRDRLTCSTAAPTVTLPEGYTVTPHPYPEAVNADIDRYIVHYCPTIEVEGTNSSDAGTRIRARRDQRRREENLRRVAGTIETRIGQVGVWVAFRPDRRTAPLSREVGEFPFSNLAVREIVRLDRQARKG